MQRSIASIILISSVTIFATAALASEWEPSASSLAEQKAEQTGSAADWSAVATLAAESYAATPSLSNELNLATAYTHIGETTLAIPLFADVVANGKYAEGTAVYNYRRGGPPAYVRFNFADEANRRLAALTGAPSGGGSRYAHQEQGHPADR